MSLIKILPEYLENFTLTLHPEVRYVSSSLAGGMALPTGSMPLSPRPSKFIKMTVNTAIVGQPSFDHAAWVADPDGDGITAGAEAFSAAILSAFNAGAAFTAFNFLKLLNNLRKAFSTVDIHAACEEYIGGGITSAGTIDNGITGRALSPAKNYKKFNITRFHSCNYMT